MVYKEENKKTLREALKSKLENGEISQEEFDSLTAKFEDLDLLGSAVEESGPLNNLSVNGSKTIHSTVVDGSVNVSGKLTATRSLKCQRIRVSGKMDVAEDLIVVGDTRISGKLSVGNNLKLGESAKVSGKLDIKNNLYTTADLKVSGKIIANDLILGGQTKISGKIAADNLRSTSSFSISGKANFEGDVFSVEFKSSGKSTIQGDLQADIVEINKSFREQLYANSSEEMEFEEIPGLASFVTKIIHSLIPGKHFGNGVQISSPSQIHGNVTAKSVDLSLVNISGDLIADNIILGPDVVVKGKIIYSQSFEAPDDFQGEVIKSNDDYEIMDEDGLTK